MILDEKGFYELADFISQINGGNAFEKKRIRKNTDGRKMLSFIMRRYEGMKIQPLSGLIYKKFNANAEILYNIKKHHHFYETDFMYRQKYLIVFDYYQKMVERLDWKPFRKSIINSIKMQGV